VPSWRGSFDNTTRAPILQLGLDLRIAAKNPSDASGIKRIGNDAAVGAQGGERAAAVAAVDRVSEFEPDPAPPLQYGAIASISGAGRAENEIKRRPSIYDRRQPAEVKVKGRPAEQPPSRSPTG